MSVRRAYPVSKEESRGMKLFLPKFKVEKWGIGFRSMTSRMVSVREIEQENIIKYTTPNLV